MDDVIYLISVENVQDATGVIRPQESRRMVYCRKRDITRSEFYNAGRAGLNPEFSVDVFQGDYEGETVAEHDGLRYAIYRTFRAEGSDYRELYLKREGGTNGENDD